MTIIGSFCVGFYTCMYTIQSFNWRKTCLNYCSPRFLSCCCCPKLVPKNCTKSVPHLSQRTKFCLHNDFWDKFQVQNTVLQVSRQVTPGQVPVGQVPGGQVPGGQVPGRTSARRTSAREDKLPQDKCHGGQVPPTFWQHQKRSGTCPPGTCPPGTCPTGTCPGVTCLLTSWEPC